MAFNHAAPKLSALDLEMASHIPPGGNWRDIPLSVPSKRLEQIRESAEAGKGSRSTYYGRLRGDLPAYTIGTYYNRPGNGCFLHPSQDRTISHREAARLQTFPDTFQFRGSQRSICKQIGNAVPPLLAFQVGLALGEGGEMVDVFAGAGGLSLGMEWAGWQSIIATDFDKDAVEAFNQNVSPVAFVGDMEDDVVLDRLTEAATRKRRSRPLILVGGPPCQGFSTGGKRRTESDARNQLHRRYTALLEKLEPDHFVFENVMGLLSMSGGEFFERISNDFKRVGYDVQSWRMNAAGYGIPQRRQRVFIVGTRSGCSRPQRPDEWTSPDDKGLELFPMAPSVSETLSDLPAILAGQSGEGLDYATSPSSLIQEFLRGQSSAAEYLKESSRVLAKRAA